MVIFGAIETLERGYFRDDAAGENFCGIELRDVSVGDALLVRGSIENRGAIRCAGSIRPLPVELCGIMGHGKEDAKQLRHR